MSSDIEFNTDNKSVVSIDAQEPNLQLPTFKVRQFVLPMKLVICTALFPFLLS